MREAGSVAGLGAQPLLDNMNMDMHINKNMNIHIHTDTNSNQHANADIGNIHIDNLIAGDVIKLSNFDDALNH